MMPELYIIHQYTLLSRCQTRGVSSICVLMGLLASA